MNTNYNYTTPVGHHDRGRNENDDNRKCARCSVTMHACTVHERALTKVGENPNDNATGKVMDRRRFGSPLTRNNRIQWHFEIQTESQSM